LLGLNKRTYELAGEETEGNVPGSYKEPGIGWMTGFLFAVSFVGIVALIPLRKVGKTELSYLFPRSQELRHYPFYFYPSLVPFPIIARQNVLSSGSPVRSKNKQSLSFYHPAHFL